MATSEEELAKQREKNQRLREQIAEANALRAERESEMSREVEMSQLQAEEARLTAQLDQSKAASSAQSIKAAAATLLGETEESSPKAAPKGKE